MERVNSEALVRGAKFGGLAGRGNAAGRTFRVEVWLGPKKRNRQPVTVSPVQSTRGRLYTTDGKTALKSFGVGQSSLSQTV
jgi:hypothetical protein